MPSFVVSLLAWPPLVAVAALAILALFVRKFAFGCVLSLVSVALAISIMIGFALGDCFPSPAVTCPSAREVHALLLCIAAVVLLSNGLMWIRIARRKPHAGK